MFRSGSLKMSTHVFRDGGNAVAVAQPIFWTLLERRNRADDVALTFLALDDVHDLLEANGALHQSLQGNTGETRAIRLEADVLCPELDEIVLERRERTGRVVQLERQRLRPSVNR